MEDGAYLFTFPWEVRSVVISSAAMSMPVFAAAFLPLRGRSTHSEALCPMAPQFLQAPCRVEHRKKCTDQVICNM